MSKKNRFGSFMYFLPRLIVVSIFLGFVAMTVLSNFDIIEQYLYPLHAMQGRVREVTPNILIGPYPHGHEVRELKKRGISLDISLLNLSLPQELVLHERLKSGAAREGIEVHSFPLSYLNLGSRENRETIAKVAAFVRQNSGRKIYIHCYLGRHRVKVVEEELKLQGLLK